MSKVKLASPQPIIDAGVYDVGIDVSHYQGRINWGKVAKAGIKYTWIKATEGVTFRDKNLERNTKGALDAGLQVGWYHYAYPSIKGDNWAYGDGHAEGEKFGETIQGLPGVSLGLPDRFLPFALDYEDGRFLSKATQQQCADWVMGWLDGLEIYVDSDYTCIYTNLNIGSTLALLPAAYTPLLWQAHYPGPSNDGVRNRQYVLDGWTPQTPEIWGEKDRYCWQYTHAGMVPGVGRCDINVRARQVGDGEYSDLPPRLPAEHLTVWPSRVKAADDAVPTDPYPFGGKVSVAEQSPDDWGLNITPAPPTNYTISNSDTYDITRIEQDRTDAMNEILVDTLSREHRKLVDRVHTLATRARWVSDDLHELQDDLEDFLEHTGHFKGNPAEAPPAVLVDGLPPTAPPDMFTRVPASESLTPPPEPDSEEEREAQPPATQTIPIADLPLVYHGARQLPDGRLAIAKLEYIDGEYWDVWEDGSKSLFVMPDSV